MTSTPTYSEALANWLAYSEKIDKIDSEELKSAKNFSRAFQIWYNKALKPGDVTKDKINADMLWHAVDQFAWDFELEADPILERLDPGSKTKRIAINYRKFVEYLHEQKVIDPNDRSQSIKAAELLGEDLQRLQRASWVLRQTDVCRAFGTKIEDDFYPVDREKREAILKRENSEDRTYEIVHIGQNFVLADRCDDLGRPELSSDDPVMIKLPSAAIKYLKPGDTIDAAFEQANDGNYWVIQMFIGLDSGTEKFDENRLYWSKRGEMTLGIDGLNLNEKNEPPTEKPLSEKVKEFRYSQEYRKRKEKVMETPPPEDRSFPQDNFSDDWFANRETDIGSDEEIGTMWDTIGGEGDILLLN